MDIAQLPSRSLWTSTKVGKSLLSIFTFLVTLLSPILQPCFDFSQPFKASRVSLLIFSSHIWPLALLLGGMVEAPWRPPAPFDTTQGGSTTSMLRVGHWAIALAFHLHLMFQSGRFTSTTSGAGSSSVQRISGEHVSTGLVRRLKEARERNTMSTIQNENSRVLICPRLF